MSDTNTLGGAVTSHFTFGKPEDYAPSVEASRVEQEQICGYALQVKNLKQTHYQDDKGRDVYEVWATFEPKAVKPLVTQGSDGTFVNAVNPTS